MPSNPTLVISLFFHLIATTVWVGGLIMQTIIVWPEINRQLQNNPARYTLFQRLRNRFTPFSNLSLAVLVVTGMFQMSLDDNYNGFLDFGNDWSRVILFKHIALAGMVVCGVLLQYGVFPELERTTLLLQKDKGKPEDWQKLRQREVLLTRVNILLGLAVLGFSAWAGTL